MMIGQKCIYVTIDVLEMSLSENMFIFGLDNLRTHQVLLALQYFAHIFDCNNAQHCNLHLGLSIFFMKSVLTPMSPVHRCV